jgi:Leucine rich repeat variant
MVNKDLRKKFSAQKVFRGTQAILGERQHLLEVLRSVQKAKIPTGRKQAEKRALEKLIRVRTQELNRINPGWDKKFKRAGNPTTSARELLRLAVSLPQDDYLLARLITEHANATAEILQRFTRHPYPAVRENVARHPNTPPELLKKLAEEKSEPLWFLVACNPSTPPDLRERLRARMAASASP